MMDEILERGRFGMPFFFRWVEMDIRAGEGMCIDRCGLVRAHLVTG